MKVYGYWHNRAVDGKQWCNHYAHSIGGDCGKPDLGVWTPLVKLTPEVEQAEAAAARLRSMAALFDQPLNRDQEHTFTGHALAEMLRGEG